MTSGPRNTPVAPNTSDGSPTVDGTLPAGVDSIGEGFDGSSVLETTGDAAPSSVTPELPLPEGATETEKELAEELEEVDSV